MLAKVGDRLLLLKSNVGRSRNALIKLAPFLLFLQHLDSQCTLSEGSGLDLLLPASKLTF